MADLTSCRGIKKARIISVSSFSDRAIGQHAERALAGGPLTIQELVDAVELGDEETRLRIIREKIDEWKIVIRGDQYALAVRK